MRAGHLTEQEALWKPSFSQRETKCDTGRVHSRGVESTLLLLGSNYHSFLGSFHDCQWFNLPIYSFKNYC